MKKVVFFLLLANAIHAQNVNSFADAVKYFNFLKVQEYLKSGADPNTLVDGEPAICYMAKFQSANTTPIFDELLKYGANPNSISSQGNSVLTITMSIYNAKSATELIKRGADLNYKNKGTLPPPLIMAIAGKYNWPQSDIFPELIKFMMTNKADVNIQDSYKNTPLMMVTQSNDFELVKYFLGFNADPNIANLPGETPLMIASARGQIETMNLLFEHGADPNKIPGDKETALMRATKEGHKDAVVLLLAKGAKTHFKNTYKETALHIALEKGYKEIADVLKKAGAKN